MSGVEREMPPSSSFLFYADFFENSLRSMVSSSFISFADLRKIIARCDLIILPLLCLHICRLLQKFTLLHGVFFLTLLCRLHQIMLYVLVFLSFLYSTDPVKTFLHSVVYSPFLSSSGFDKNLLCILVSLSFLYSAVFLKYSL